MGRTGKRTANEAAARRVVPVGIGISGRTGMNGRIRGRAAIGMIAAVSILLSCAGVGTASGGETEGAEVPTVLGGTSSGAGLEVRIVPGSEWFHDYPLFLWFKKKNTPTYAVWTEDASGSYLETLYASRKVASDGWIGNERRPESLPYWAHSRNVQASDGLYLPTQADPLPDSVSGATPKGESVVSGEVPESERFSVYLEINHSIDYNDAYPEDPSGTIVNGQPSLVYGAVIDRSLEGPVKLRLLGHGSPDGSDGTLDADLSGITSAADIVGSVEVIVRTK